MGEVILVATEAAEAIEMYRTIGMPKHVELTEAMFQRIRDTKPSAAD